MLRRELSFVSALPVTCHLLPVTMSDERLQQKLAQLDAQLSNKGEEEEQEKTSTRTRDRLAAVEEELAKCKVGATTSTRTREKLAEAER